MDIPVVRLTGKKRQIYNIRNEMSTTRDHGRVKRIIRDHNKQLCTHKSNNLDESIVQKAQAIINPV